MKRAFSRKNLWDATPRPIKRVLSPLLGLLPPAAYLGRRFRANLRSLRQAQHWSADQAGEYQLRRLREICSLAYEETVFYRRSFDAAGFDPDKLKSLNDFSAIPTLDKAMVRRNVADMCAVPADAPGVDYGSTGGTSGEPLEFYMPSNRSAIEYSHLIASWERAGYRLGMPLAVLRGHVLSQNRSGMYYHHDPILRHHYYSSFHLDDETMASYLRHISTIGDCFLHVYPSVAAMLARFLSGNSRRPPENIRGIIAESEIVHDGDRRLVEETFGKRVFSCYGHSEKLVLASACEHSDHYHVWPTYGYFELLDDQGQPITTPGQRGEIVGTGFINNVMPFIRYRTGDFATFVSNSCPACGRKHICIESIDGGRSPAYNLVAADGSIVPMIALQLHDDTWRIVRQYQFYQDTPGEARLLVVPASGTLPQEECDRILRNFRVRLDGQVKLSLQQVPEVRTTSRGKIIYVDQRLDFATHYQSELQQQGQEPARSTACSL